MEKAKKKSILGQILLFATALVWGSSFAVAKDLFSTVPAYYTVAIRYVFSAVVLWIVFFKKAKIMKKGTVLRGFIIGLFVTAACVLQTEGLKISSPGKNAFLSCSYCVLCPFLAWAAFKRRPAAKNIISAFLCLAGIGFIALSGDALGTGQILGDAMSLAASLFFGLQIIFTELFLKKGHDAICLLLVELSTIAVAFVILSFSVELPVSGIEAFSLDGGEILRLLYLAAVCSLFPQFAQIIGQKMTSPETTSLIVSLQSVFAVVVSLILGMEEMTVFLGVGFILVFAAIMLSEINFDRKKQIRIEKNDTDDEKKQT